MRFLGVNAAGLRSKLLTFKKVLADLKPSVFFIEETKYKDIGKLKFDNYVVFEVVRKSRDGGGGLAIGCVNDLKPVWLREGTDDVEALSVEIVVQKMRIRCCVAYGCQENASNERKEAFWTYIEEEVVLAKNTGSGFVMHFDGNLWAGDKIIPGDPRPQNKNGKLFEGFLSKHPHLSVVNALSLCDGLITRSRMRDGKLEESVLDFFVVCSLVLPHITKMVIDVDKKYILTNYEQVRKGGKANDTDHTTEIMDVDLKIINEKPERREIFDFKNVDSQNTFKRISSETVEFTECFNNDLPLSRQIEKWSQVLKSYCGKAFKKIRICSKQNVKPLKSTISNLINKRNKLLRNNNECEKQEIEEANENISNLEAEERRNCELEPSMENFKKVVA